MQQQLQSLLLLLLCVRQHCATTTNVCVLRALFAEYTFLMFAYTKCTHWLFVLHFLFCFSVSLKLFALFDSVVGKLFSHSNVKRQPSPQISFFVYFVLHIFFFFLRNKIKKIAFRAHLGARSVSVGRRRLNQNNFNSLWCERYVCARATQIGVSNETQLCTA